MASQSLPKGMKRSTFIKQSTLATAGILFSKYSLGGSQDSFPVVRIPVGQRKFNSPAVERLISDVKKNIRNKELGWLFENCFPNTLDTTVNFEIIDGKPDTFVITGDIDAMWLRDSSAQVWPYLPLMKEDKNLQELIKGVINRQVKCILKDPYANAFYKDENKISEWKNDKTTMKPGVHERKWEIDSLCYPIRLAYGYWKHTGDRSPFDKEWSTAMQLIVKTFKEQQRLENEGPYHFQRETTNPTDSLPLGGYGSPTRKIGLIHSMFRPSDDATVYPFLIPSNVFAQHSLGLLSEMTEKIDYADKAITHEAGTLSNDLGKILKKYGILDHPDYGKIYPYEINGLGSYNVMDDSNIPSLLSLPYLGCVKNDDIIYQDTRKLILSKNNPFFFKGTAAEGIGGPHVGMDYIWPMSIIMRGLTSNNSNEIRYCLQSLQKSHGGTGFMHESFHKDDVTRFTRSWFAWANTLFGEFIWTVYKKNPHLLSA